MVQNGQLTRLTNKYGFHISNEVPNGIYRLNKSLYHDETGQEILARSFQVGFCRKTAMVGGKRVKFNPRAIEISVKESTRVYKLVATVYSLSGVERILRNISKGCNLDSMKESAVA